MSRLEMISLSVFLRGCFRGRVLVVVVGFGSAGVFFFPAQPRQIKKQQSSFVTRVFVCNGTGFFYTIFLQSVYALETGKEKVSGSKTMSTTVWITRMASFGALSSVNF